MDNYCRNCRMVFGKNLKVSGHKTFAEDSIMIRIECEKCGAIYISRISLEDLEIDHYIQGKIQ